jgi:hypothetical protein
VDAAHSAGWLVYTWTLRPRNRFLATAYRRGRARRRSATGSGSSREVIGTGVDGIFVDHPDLGSRRGARHPARSDVRSLLSSHPVLLDLHVPTAIRRDSRLPSSVQRGRKERDHGPWRRVIVDPDDQAIRRPRGR